METRSRIYSVIEVMPLEKLDAVVAFLEDLQRSSEEETASPATISAERKNNDKVNRNDTNKYCA